MMGEPEPEHWAVAALLDELESLGMVRVPHGSSAS